MPQLEFDASVRKAECTDQSALGGGSRHPHVQSCWVRPVDAFGWHWIVLRHVTASLTNSFVAHRPSAAADNRNRSATSRGSRDCG
jgi:hypothetical protein